MLTLLKNLIAGPELAQLKRYRRATLEARIYCAAFPDAVDALDHVEGVARFDAPLCPQGLAEGMLVRREKDRAASNE
jgi:hypothetical protein